MWEDESVTSDYNSDFTLKLVNTYQDYYPYMGQTTLQIRVSVNSRFSGSDNFYFTLEKIKSAIEILNRMHQDLKGICEFKNMEIHSDSFFKLEMVDFGHVSVTGQFGSMVDDDYLKFSLYSDQTVLPRLIQILQEMTKE